MSTTKERSVSRESSLQRREGSERDGALLAGMLSDLKLLLEDEYSADLFFLIEHEVVRAHQLVVMARCERQQYNKLLERASVTEDHGTAAVTIQLGKQFSATAVRDVVAYLYTGKVSLQSKVPFSLLQVCAEFGLPLLQSYLTHHVTSHLTPETVCQTLVGASSLMKAYKDDILAVALKQIVQESMEYIISHARAVLQGEGLTSLSKEMFLRVISSNELSIHEEEVWHAVVRWGQFKAGVKTTMILWTEKDRALIKKSLHGVLEQVRVMDINSDVFAREVEPTGLLPMEMVLDRYRLAATNGEGGEHQGVEGGGLDQQVSCLRGGIPEPFADSVILEGRLDLQLKILEWVDPSSLSEHCHGNEWVLLYMGSRDGYNAKEFHSVCDNKGPTITIVKTPSGCVLGGYSDVDWSSRFKRGKFAGSQESFLYSLIGPQASGDTHPTKFPIHQPSYAVNNHPNNGPIFGAGADLCISSDCDQNMDSYSQLGHSYGDPAHPGQLADGNYFTVEDYEVFGLIT